jgi:hypothetical protein
MSLNEFSHYFFFLGLFVAFTYNKKQPPAFGATLAFWCILFPFLGLLFCHIPNNLSNYNVLTANAPQISGTWSNHEGSILLWCWIYQMTLSSSLLFYWSISGTKSNQACHLSYRAIEAARRSIFLLLHVVRLYLLFVGPLWGGGGLDLRLFLHLPIEAPVPDPAGYRDALLTELEDRIEERIFGRTDVMNPGSDQQARGTAQLVVTLICVMVNPDIPFLEEVIDTLNQDPPLIDELLDPLDEWLEVK